MRCRLSCWISVFAFWLALYIFVTVSPMLSYMSMDDTPYSQTGIPLVVHQTWKTRQVPSSLSPYLLSWMENQPTWRYRFWTDLDASKMVQEHFPELQSTYDNYLTSIFRADAMRYMLLYQYGGIYADLDVQSLKPMDDLLDTYPCILSQEMPLHKSYYSEGFISNALMICRPKHPFYKFVLDILPQRNYYRDPLRATGPLMLEHVLRKFMNVKKISSRYDGIWLPEVEIYVAPWYMFLPTYDPLRQDEFYDLCNVTLYNSKGDRRKMNESVSDSETKGIVRQCELMEKTGWRNEPGKKALTDHHWVHTYSTNFAHYHSPGTATVNVTELMSSMLLVNNK